MSEEEDKPAAPEGGEVAAEAKETKSFEERLAELKKPEAVPNPDQDQVNGKLSKLNAHIEKCDKRLSEIKAQLDKANSERDRSKDATKGVLEQLKANRARMALASREKEKCFQALRDMTQSRQAQQKSLQDLRKSLKFQDIGEVEDRIRILEAQIEQGQCANLAEEKRTINEIKQLNQMKATITQYQTQRATVVDDSSSKADLEARKAAAQAEIALCKAENEKLEKELEAKRVKTTEGGPNVNDLWKEQKELYAQIKTHRAEIRKVNGDFKEEVNKWRDYQRALQSYKRAQGKIMAEQRRAEWEARKAEDDAPIDQDAPTDDPLVGHPWADEILMCSDLEKCLAFFLPKEGGSAVEQEKKVPTFVKGASLNKNNDEDEDWGSLVKTKKGSNKSKGGDAPVKAIKVVLTIDTINSLNAIGVSIPASSDQIAGCIAEVKAKKEAYNGMTEEDKKSQKKNKPAKAKTTEAADKGANVVSVDISSPDKKGEVKVKIDFPALGA